MTRHIEPGTRIMDRAWLRDELDTVYTGEALLLILLLRAKANAGRGSKEETNLRKYMKDQNLG